MQSGMDTVSQSVAVALGLVADLDPRLTEIVRLSLAVSLTATLISAAMFTIGRWVVATWLATSEAVSSFGAAASLALVLLWFYYSAVIFYTAAVIAAETGVAKDVRRKPADGERATASQDR